MEFFFPHGVRAHAMSLSTASPGGGAKIQYMLGCYYSRGAFFTARTSQGGIWTGFQGGATTHRTRLDSLDRGTLVQQQFSSFSGDHHMVFSV